MNLLTNNIVSAKLNGVAGGTVYIMQVEIRFLIACMQSAGTAEGASKDFITKQERYICLIS